MDSEQAGQVRVYRPEINSRLWIRCSTFRSAYFLSIPHSVPSPSGRSDVSGGLG
jgi:hypothetical protein